MTEETNYTNWDDVPKHGNIPIKFKQDLWTICLDDIEYSFEGDPQNEFEPFGKILVGKGEIVIFESVSLDQIYFTKDSKSDVLVSIGDDRKIDLDKFEFYKNPVLEG